MTDRATYELFDKYEGLKTLHTKAVQSLSDFNKGEAERIVAANKKRQEFQTAINNAAVQLAKSGEARVRILNSVPADLRHALETVQHELRPHEEVLADAKLRLKHQVEHAEKSRGKYDPKLDRDKFELKLLDDAVADKKKNVEREEKRCAEIRERLERAKKAVDDYARGLRATALDDGKKKATVAK